MEKVKKTRKIMLGTKEWADSNVNCYLGYSNDYRYCYAKIMAIRFNRKTQDFWNIIEPNKKSINKAEREGKNHSFAARLKLLM